MIVACTEPDVLAALREADRRGAVLVLCDESTDQAGSSAQPQPCEAPTLRLAVATKGIAINDDGCYVDDLVFCGAVLATVAAGEVWADLADRAVTEGWIGVEALVGRAGSVGSVVRDNIAAFSQLPSDTVASVRTWDRASQAQRTFAAADCGFGDGQSRFQQRLPDGSLRYVPLSVALLLKQGDLTRPINDADLADRLGIPLGERVSLDAVRRLVLG